MKFVFMFLSLITWHSTAQAQLRCHSLFAMDTSPEVQQLSEQAMLMTEKEMQRRGLNSPAMKGYAILVGSMIGSAALTTHLGSQLNSQWQFLSVFVSQVSVLGVYVLGAPIWEPLSSRFRQLAFGVRKNSQWQQNVTEKNLESVWLNTQESYSLNAQMSRNIISQFILTVRQNFYEARRAHRENDLDFSADQVAEAAYRLRVLFKDISPHEESVAAAVTAAFTHHVKVDEAYVRLVIEKLKALDEQHEIHREHYVQTLSTWLQVPQDLIAAVL